MSKYQITLDMVLETTRNAQNRICVQGKAREDFAKYSLTSAIVKEDGPAGGNAEVRLVGSYKQIEAYLRDVYAQDEEDVAFFLTRVQPYSGALEGTTLA